MPISRRIQEKVAPFYQLASPEDYGECRCAFEAGRTSVMDGGSACFLAHAVSYKLPTCTSHKDNLDRGYCCSIPTGAFEGGHVVFEDLGLVFKFVYLHSRHHHSLLTCTNSHFSSAQPGDILLFRSDLLTHAVSEWTPVGGVNEYGVAPGRVAHIYFNHKSSVEALKGRGRDYMIQTAGGMQPPKNPRVP